jgi:hypothetical protein
VFVLDATTRTLEVLLDAAPATSQLPVVVTYADTAFGSATPWLPASSNVLTSGTTAVTACAAPPASTQRQVEELTVRNDDTAARVVKLRYNDNGTPRNILWATLQPGETLEYTHAAGLRTIADGAVKVQWTAPGISQGGGFVRVNADGSVEASPAAGKNLTLDSGDMVLPSAGRLAWSTDVFLQRDGAGVLSQRNAANAQALRVYNTFTDASNGEWGAVRWNANVLEVGAYANGTGALRNVAFVGAGAYTYSGGGGTGAVFVLNDTSGAHQSCRFQFQRNGTFKWQFGTDVNTVDHADFFVFDQGAGVTRLLINSGGAAVLDGGHVTIGTDNTYDVGASGANRPRSLYLATSLELESLAWVRNNPGRKRLTANVTNATTTFSNLTDLTETLVAGRKYVGVMAVRCSDSVAADGIKFDFNGGAATTTSFNAAVAGNVQGATAGTTVSAALATALNFTAMSGTTDHWITFAVSLVCNAGGTFIPRMAQNAHSTGTATAALGSYLWLDDSP